MVLVMTRLASIIFVILSALSMLVSWPVRAEQPSSRALEAAAEANRYMAREAYSKAVPAFNRALVGGLVHPDLYRNLSIALYELRMVDDALAAMEKAVSLAPQDNLFRIELGILYLAKDRFKKTEEQLFIALKNNPGLSEAYFFLGQLYYRTNQFGLAWIGARTSEKLGYESSVLIDKLSKKSIEPSKYPWELPNKNLAIRQVILANKEEAEDFLNKVKQGDLFEYVLENEHDGLGNSLGGFIGIFTPEDLRPEIRETMLNQDVYGNPVLIELEDVVAVSQRILSFDFSQWQALTGLKLTQATVAPRLKESKSTDLNSLTDEQMPPLIRTSVDLNKVRVYAGAFYKKDKAISQVELFQKMGFPAFCLLSETTDEKSLYNVIAGQFDSRQQAEDVVKELKKQGYDSFVPIKKK